jgi:hypothetical protein
VKRKEIMQGKDRTAGGATEGVRERKTELELVGKRERREAVD